MSDLIEQANKVKRRVWVEAPQECASDVDVTICKLIDTIEAQQKRIDELTEENKSLSFSLADTLIRELPPKEQQD